MSMIIKGTGSALPEKIVTNDELAQIVETSNEWIVERAGITQRHIAAGDTTASLASAAALKALEDAKTSAEDVEIIIVASCSSEKALPCVACQVQSSIGAVNAVAFDLNAACAGFLFAMNTIKAYFDAGIYKNALVIGSEVLSNIIDWTDRGTCVLFGDGAGAVFFEKSDANKQFYFVQKSNGFKGDVLSCNQRDSKSAFYEGESNDKYVTMDGREVFGFATRVVPDTICAVLKGAGLECEDIDLYILHQANLRIIERIARRLKLDMDRFPTNVERVGNTSSASIPLLLDEIKKQGILREGMKIVLSGFGAGLTYSACVMEA